MAGPLILALLGVVAGWVAAGPAGVAGGLMLAAIVTMMVVVGGVVWARQIGAYLAPEDARAAAPCPPGFARLCAAVYDRVLERETNA